MGTNFDGFNHPDPIQKLQKPAMLRHPCHMPPRPQEPTTDPQV